MTPFNNLKTLTIIGGSGFIGKSFIDAFNRNLLSKFKINKLIIICRNTNLLKLNKFLNLKKIKIIKGDIGYLKKIPKSDLIIYAAESTTPKIYKKKEFIEKEHLRNINNFCNIITNNKNAKILYLSSGSVNQNKKYKNSNYKKIYTYLKKYSEKKIKELSNYKIKISIARCFTFVGPWLPKNAQYAIGNFINDGMNKNFIKVKSKNLVYRSYLYSDDLVEWLIKIVISSKISCPIYNVGSDKKIEIQKVAEIIGHFFNKPVKCMFKKRSKINEDKYIPNINKTKDKLKLKINYNLKQSIYLTINHNNYEKKN